VIKDLIGRIDNADPHAQGANWKLLCEAGNALERQQQRIEELEGALKEIIRMQPGMGEYNLKTVAERALEKT